jgi:hypothetical protein
MRPSVVSPMIFALLATPPGEVGAQAPSTPPCSDSLGKSMAFLRGEWEGRSYSVSGADTTLDALMKVHSQPLFGGCALEERWVGMKDDRVLFTASVVRAYDAPTQRRSVYYVDDQLNSQVYERRREAGQWRFLRTRLDQGVPIHVRLTWRPTGHGYEQLIERSRDAGATWTLGGFVSFRAVPDAGSR